MLSQIGRAGSLDNPASARSSFLRLLPSPGNVLFTLLVVLGLIAARLVSPPTPTNTHQAATGAIREAPLAVAASSTQTIAYQGRLTDAGGNLVSGTYPMTFKLYNQSSGAAGGSPLWTESDTVTVSNGIFNVPLGSASSVSSANLLSVVSANNSLWLGITVGTDPEMTPPVPLASAPYAMQAQTVPNGSIGTAQLANNAVTYAQLAANAATQPVATPVLGYADNNQPSTPDFVAIPLANIPITTNGGTVLVFFTESVTVDTAGANLQWRIIRDGSTVVTWNNQDFPAAAWQSISLLGIDLPSAGSHVYTVQWKVDRGTVTAGAGYYTQNFAALELKR